MKLEFNRQQLLELMRDFHTLSGIRIVLFDDEYHELLSYPEQPCKFCSLLKSNPETKGLCDASDARSFREAEAKKKLILFMYMILMKKIGLQIGYLIIVKQ